ncbi:MAG: DUF6186 family protein [Acidimicrobiales bacterium]
MSRGAVIGIWAVLAGAAVLVELVARWWRRSDSLGTAVRRLLGRRAGAITLLLGWAWLGWHVFAR